MVPVPVYSCKVSSAVKNDAVKKTEQINRLKTLTILILLILTIWLKKLTQKIGGTEKKKINHNDDKCIATQEVYQLKSENFAAKVKLVDLTSK